MPRPKLGEHAHFNGQQYNERRSELSGESLLTEKKKKDTYH